MDTFVRYLGKVDIVGHAKDVDRHRNKDDVSQTTPRF